MSAHAVPQTHPLPLVVQLGFAGSRKLFDPRQHPEIDEAAFEAAILEKLRLRLQALPNELGLKANQHFVCGVSQVAIGGDTLFTRALQALGWPQRVFLPQTRDVFLTATASDGTPDFSPAQQDVAARLLASDHVIEERLASDSSDRHTRFMDVNREIERGSDLAVCLLRENATGQPGGTNDLVERCRGRGKPVLELTVCFQRGTVELSEVWHQRERFVVPALDESLAGAELNSPATTPRETDVVAYCQSLKGYGSRRAVTLRNLFKVAALVVNGTHIAATILALFALVVHDPSIVPALLLAELACLLFGFVVHAMLHHSEASHRWARSRLTAELARSVLAIGKRHLALDYLFTLAFPEALRPLLRTLNVLHLRSTVSGDDGRDNAASARQVDSARSSYFQHRLDPPAGQLAYYRDYGARARFWLRASRTAFWIGSLGAIVLTTCKLLMQWHVLPIAPDHEPLLANLFGAAAVLLPLVAVAALSLSASHDTEARAGTYSEMERFLTSQRGQMEAARDEREFDRLLLETESRLLGETVSWYTRRSHLS